MFNQEDAFSCAETIRARLPGFQPRAALILGSGLGASGHRQAVHDPLDQSEHRLIRGGALY
jgi:xanthosine phosphorylase